MKPEQVADNQADLLTFTRTMFQARKGAPLLDNWHQDKICSALERAVIGQCPRLIINIPPRSGKTELAVINFIGWCMGNWPDSEFIHASYSKRLATNNTYNARALLQEEVYKEIFPHTSIRGDSSAKDEFRTEQGGVVYATGAGGTITGYGGGKIRPGFGGAIVIDDPHKAGEASSELMRENIIDWFGTTIESRKNTPDTPIVVIMQRLHEQDLTGFLLDGGNGEEWEHVLIPGEDEDGESFWPEQFPVEMLERVKKTNPYVYAGQYTQRPAPLGGGMFPVDRFEIIEHNPAPKDIEISIRSWDKAGTSGGGAYTAGVLMHKLHDGRYVISDVQRGQWSALDRERRIRQTAEMDGKDVRIVVEQEPGSGGKESVEGTIRSLSGFRVTGDRVTGDKETRAEPYAAQVQGGNVMLCRGSWNREFMNEHESFPNGQYKDQVDAAAGAFASINGRQKKMQTHNIKGLI